MHLHAPAVAALLSLSLVVACQHQRVPMSSPNFSPCDDFQVPDTIINLAAGDSIQLGDVGLVVPGNALNGTLALRVHRGNVQPRAGSVSLEAIGVDSATFNNPIFVRMSYARCPAIDTSSTRSVYRVDGGRREEQRVTDLPSSKVMRFPRSTLSEYAMAGN